MWVLTGDKIETAINIGYSCQLLNDDLEKILIDGIEEKDIDNALDDGLKKISNEKEGKFALIISGDALIHGVKSPYSQKVALFKR